MLPAPGEAAHPALALVNSSRVGPRGPVDELEDPASLHGWLAAHGLPAEGADPGALRDLRALRDAVRELLRARIEDRLPAAPALVAVNAAAAAAPTAPRLVWTHEPREERDAPGAARPAALAGALLAGDAIGLVTGPAHADLRACSAPGCVRLMLKDHPRRHWCSTLCGDRVRASRYYHRHRKGTAA